MNFNEQALHDLLGRAITDFGAAFQSGLLVIGDQLGLYRALSEGGPMDSAELAGKTGTAERYVREWLCAQAAGGYVQYDAETGKFSMTPEQTMALVDETSPAFLPGAFQSAVASLRIVPRMMEAFRSGDGVGWHEHDAGLFEGTERFFRPNYLNNLVQNWIPALDGVEERLKAGAHVADVGCGLGASTILMAEAYPESTFRGFDYHDKSIELARERAKEAGVADRITFETASSTDYQGDGYDFVCFFDCLHDMGDPVGACTHVHRTLKTDGTLMIVEPYAGDKVEDNLNPIGRAFYAVSTLVCTPASLSQEVGLGLGAQAGEARLRDVCTKAGFSSFRRATQTPFNLILEAKP